MSIYQPENFKRGMKIAAQVTPEPSDEDLRFLKQMGVEYVVLWTDAKKSSYEYYASRRRLFEEAGLRVYGFSHGPRVSRGYGG